MSKLSPAAQAVLDAIKGELDHAPWELSYLAGSSAAAALRAALDEVVPEHREHHPATLDERWRKVSAFDVRNRFLAIAAELEAQ